MISSVKDAMIDKKSSFTAGNYHQLGGKGIEIPGDCETTCKSPNVQGTCQKYMSVYKWCGDERDTDAKGNWLQVAMDAGDYYNCKHCVQGDRNHLPALAAGVPQAYVPPPYVPPPQSSGSWTNYQCRTDAQWINNHGHTCAEIATNPDAKSDWVDRTGKVAAQYCKPWCMTQLQQATQNVPQPQQLPDQVTVTIPSTLEAQVWSLRLQNSDVLPGKGAGNHSTKTIEECILQCAQTPTCKSAVVHVKDGDSNTIGKRSCYMRESLDSGPQGTLTWSPVCPSDWVSYVRGPITKTCDPR